MRALVILHMCLLCTGAIQILGAPFLGEHYDLARLKNRYDFVLGRTQDRLNLERFASLPQERQKNILQDYELLERRFHRPFGKKWADGVLSLGNLSPFLLEWWILSLLLCLVIRKSAAEIHLAVWLLPLLIACSLGEHWCCRSPESTADQNLIPKEEHLLSRYGAKDRGLQELRRCWNLYLCEEWGKGAELPLEEGRFRFQLAYLEGYPENFRQDRGPSSLWLLGLFGWNLFFSWGISERCRDSSVAKLTPPGWG